MSEFREPSTEELKAIVRLGIGPEGKTVVISNADTIVLMDLKSRDTITISTDRPWKKGRKENG